MIKQIKYFQAIVRCQKFTKAAEECFISQSAISQQIQALEKELGVNLLLREGRKFSLTPAGDFFYRKSLVLINDFDRLLRDTVNLAKGSEQKISVGYLRHFDSSRLKKTVAEFSEQFPDIAIEFIQGTHEELYDLLRKEKVDIVISDLRREPSEQYVKFFLTTEYFYAELPSKNPLAQLDSLTADDLKNTPIILIAPIGDRLNEEMFFREYLGIKSEFIFAENLDDAHLMVISNKGYLPVTNKKSPQNNDFLSYVPIIFNGNPFYCKYYAFWRADSTRPCIENFASIFKANITGF